MKGGKFAGFDNNELINMYLYKIGHPIFIFGTSKRAILKFCLWRDKFNVLGFIENNIEMCREKKDFLDLPLYFCGEIPNLIKQFPEAIFVVADDRYIGLSKWLNIRFKFIEKWTLDVFFDYKVIDLITIHEINLSDDNIEKLILLMKKELKVFCIFGNCQTIIAKMYLLNNEKFTSNYIILDLPPIHLFKEKNHGILERIVWYKFINDFAIIRIKEDNKINPIFSSNRFIDRLEETCNVIIIPNFWFTAYYPQFIKEYSNSRLQQFNIVYARYGDSVLNNLIDSGYSFEDIIKEKRTLISETDIKNNIQQCFNNVKKAEENCDIKMTDWFIENYHKQILFWSPNHPKNIVVKELVNRLLLHMNLYSLNTDISYKYEKIIDNKETLRSPTCIVYPSVYDYLNIKYEDIDYCPGQIDMEMIQGFEEYIYNYLIFSCK